MIKETRKIRLKRLTMRSWRRGTKEMDLILGNFADNGLGGLTLEQTDIYEALLEEADHDLYQWFTDQMPAPEKYARIIGIIGGF